MVHAATHTLEPLGVCLSELDVSMLRYSSQYGTGTVYALVVCRMLGPFFNTHSTLILYILLPVGYIFIIHHKQQDTDTGSEWSPPRLAVPMHR